MNTTTRTPWKQAGLVLVVHSARYRLHLSRSNRSGAARVLRLRPEVVGAESLYVEEFEDRPPTCTCRDGRAGLACAHVGAIEALVEQGLLAPAGPTWESLGEWAEQPLSIPGGVR